MTIYVNFNCKQSRLYILGVSSVEIRYGSQQTRFLLLDLRDLLRIVVLCTSTEE